MPAKKTAKTVKQQPQQMVDFGTAISNFWSKYVDFMGTAQRSEFWFSRLFLFLVNIPLTLFETIVPEFIIFSVLWGLAVFIPTMAQSVRRFRDAGVPVVLYFVLNPLWPILFLVITSAAVAVGVDSYMAEEDVFALGVLAFLFGLMAFGFAIFFFVVYCLPSKSKTK